MCDPTFDLDIEERKYEAAETDSLIGGIWDPKTESYVGGIWDWAVANHHVPRPTVAGLLLAAGLEAESAEFASWLIVRERADNGHRSAIVELATACAFDASDWAWRNGYGMTKANCIANWVDDAVRAVYEVGTNGHQRDKLDKALASVVAEEPWSLLPDERYFSEPAIPLAEPAREAATKRAAAAGLRRGFTK